MAAEFHWSSFTAGTKPAARLGGTSKLVTLCLNSFSVDSVDGVESPLQEWTAGCHFWVERVRLDSNQTRIGRHPRSLPFIRWSMSASARRSKTHAPLSGKATDIRSAQFTLVPHGPRFSRKIADDDTRAGIVNFSV